MIRKFLYIIVFTLLFTSIGKVSAQTDKELKIPVQISKVVRDFSKDTSITRISFGEDGDKTRERIYLKFDISTVKNLTVNTANLNLKVSSCGGPEINVSFGRIIGEWDPSTITWENKPGFSTPNGSFFLDCVNQIASFDMRDILEVWMNNDYPNYGIVIYGPEDLTNSQYFREFDLSAENSFIAINYSDAPKTQTDQNARVVDTNSIRIVLFLILTLIFAIIVFIIRLLFKKKKVADKEKIEDNVVTDLEKDSGKEKSDETPKKLIQPIKLASKKETNDKVQ